MNTDLQMCKDFKDFAGAHEELLNCKRFISEVSNQRSSFWNALNVAITACEYRVPKDVLMCNPYINKDEIIYTYRCPRCNSEVSAYSETEPFCKHCGQALDWSNTDWR